MHICIYSHEHLHITHSTTLNRHEPERDSPVQHPAFQVCKDRSVVKEKEVSEAHEIVLNADGPSASHCSDDAKSGYYNYTHVALKTSKWKCLSNETGQTKQGRVRNREVRKLIDTSLSTVRHDQYTPMKGSSSSSILSTAILRHLLEC